MLAKRMKHLTPYTPGEQPQDRSYIKLNTNENPYPPTPKVKEFLCNFDIERLRLYPDPASYKIKEAVAEERGLKPENVFVGNGSDEVLSFCYYAFFDGSGGPLLFPEFTYSFYPVYAEYYDVPFQRVPLAPDYTIDLEAFLTTPSCGTILPNPNAPTGIALSRETIRSFLERYPSDKVVVIDEAYIDFGAESVASLINDFPNLLVIQTFSKGWSLAALRLGYAMGQPRVITALNTVKDSVNSYPVDMLAQNIGILAIKDQEYFSEMSGRIQESRRRFMASLKGMGWTTLPSMANFVFTRKEGWQGKDIYLKLKESGFLVRHFDTKGIRDFVRITIGTEEDMASLTEAMSRLIV